MHPFINLGFCKISVFPLLLIFAIFSCLIIFLKSKKYDSFYFSKVKKAMIFVMIFSGLVGKILFALTQICKPEISLVDLFSGFVFFGGFIGGEVGLVVYCKLCDGRFLDLSDVFTSLLPLGQAIGRLGCYFNGCCYGKEYNGFLAVRYIADGKYVSVFPTWFIESVFCFLMFVFFFKISKKKKSGFYTAIYMVVYPCFRFWIEFFRGDVIRGIWNGISTSQIISIWVMLCGVGIAIYSYINNDKNIMIPGRKK